MGNQVKRLEKVAITKMELDQDQVIITFIKHGVAWTVASDAIEVDFRSPLGECVISLRELNFDLVVDAKFMLRELVVLGDRSSEGIGVHDDHFWFCLELNGYICFSIKEPKMLVEIAFGEGVSIELGNVVFESADCSVLGMLEELSKS